MKRHLFMLSVLVALTAAAISASPASAQSGGSASPSAHAAHASPPKIKIAPADEYFGKLKMSILGIANTIKDQSLKYERQPEQLTNEINAVNFAVDAIRDWERKYPKDPWVAKSLFALERFYQRIDSDEARAQARATMSWLVRDFPDTWYGKTGKRELVEGKVGAAHQAAQGPAPIDITKPVLGEATAAPAAPR